MKILSIFALMVAFGYGILIFKRARAKMDEENIFSILVCLCLGWMAFCEALFYSAASKEEAWLWHQLGALGWSGFIGVTAWFFLAMAKVTRRLPLPAKVIYWGVSIGITLRFVLLRPTALAEDLVLSGSGLGWTYIQTYHSVCTAVFIAYMLIYLGGSLAYLLYWQRKEEKANIRHLAKGFVILDFLSVTIGITTYLIVPHFTSYLPPMGWLALLFFLAGYSGVLLGYDLSHFEMVIDPQLILDSSVEPMMILDDTFRILYANLSMKNLFHSENLVDHFLPELLPLEEREIFEQNAFPERWPTHSMAINLRGGEAALMSVNQVNARRNSQKFYMIAMHDISQIRQNQIQMEHMAYYDELTGLANRRRLGELLDIWEQNYHTCANDFLMILMDLNNFKSVNDRFGHDAGDQALIAVSHQLKKTVAAGDEAFRLSGDEFVILHLMKKQDRAEDIIGAVRNGIQSINTSHFAAGIRLDAAIGSCLYSEYHDVRQMMKKADEHMYEMKRLSHHR